MFTGVIDHVYHVNEQTGESMFLIWFTKSYMGGRNVTIDNCACYIT